MKFIRKKIAGITFTRIEKIDPNVFVATYKWHNIFIKKDKDAKLFDIYVTDKWWYICYDWDYECSNLEQAILQSLKWSKII